MNVFDKLDEAINDMIASRKAFSGQFSRKDLKDYLAHLQTEHLMVIKVLDGALPEIGSGIAKAVAENTKNYPAYIGFRKRLSNQQRSVESKMFLGTLLSANKKYVEILQEVEKDVDKLFSFDRINMLNLRMSHLIVAGLIHQSRSLCRFTKYTLGYVSSTFLGLSSTPRYREAYLVKNSDYVAEIVSSVNDKSGAVDYKALIKKIKKSAADYTLIDKEANSQVSNIAGVLKLGRSSEGVVTAGVLGLPSFRSIGEAINLVRHEIGKYLKQEETWMRSHVAILNAKLEGKDKNDDDYIQLEKIISRYESMVDMLERLRNEVG